MAHYTYTFTKTGVILGSNANLKDTKLLHNLNDTQTSKINLVKYGLDAVRSVSISLILMKPCQWMFFR